METVFADAFHICLYVPDVNGRTGVHVCALMSEPLRHGVTTPAALPAREEVPSAVAGRVILTLPGDASTSVAVTRRTPFVAEEVVLQRAPAVPPVQGTAGESVRLDLAAASTPRPGESGTAAPEGGTRPLPRGRH